MPMPKTQPEEKKVLVKCDQVPSCGWETWIVPRLQTQQLGLHRAIAHKVFSKDPAVVAQREARQAKRKTEPGRQIGRPRGEPIHQCEVPGCKECFSRVRDRDQHRRRDHGPKPFSCQFCGDVFTTYKFWQRHERAFCSKRPKDAPVPLATEPARDEQPEAPQTPHVAQEAAPVGGVEVDPTALAQALVETLRSLMAEKARGEWDRGQSSSEHDDNLVLEALADEQAKANDRLKKELRGLQDQYKALAERHAEMRTAYVKLEQKEKDTAVELGRQKTVNKKLEEDLAENRVLRRSNGNQPRPLSNPVLSATEVGALMAAPKAKSY